MAHEVNAMWASPTRTTQSGFEREGEAIAARSLLVNTMTSAQHGP
jgi:hypothetical protein